MKKVIQFSKFFLPAAIISVLIIAFSIFGFIYNEGFALGVDFQAGHIQEVQIAPTAFNIKWNGSANATLSHDRNNINIIISGTGIESRTHQFAFSEYTTIGSLTDAMKEQLEDLEISIAANAGVNTRRLVFSSLGNPNLSDTPFVIHYLEQGSIPIDISDVRTAMAGFTQGVSVQSMGEPSDRQFMIRIEDHEEGRVTSSEIVEALERNFNPGSIAVLRSDYVGSRFSKDLTDQAGILVALTLLIILIYLTIRFKMQYAVGAVIAIMHDCLVVIACMVWIRMEFTTLSIAAILTILGYSVNNTIIFFDRVRENMRINPDQTFKDVTDISLSGILGRTIITTATTMLAILSLFIFTTGAMKDFALALLIGMVSGVYTTLYIVPGFINKWQDNKIKREKKKAAKQFSTR